MYSAAGTSSSRRHNNRRRKNNNQIEGSKRGVDDGDGAGRAGRAGRAGADAGAGAGDGAAGAGATNQNEAGNPNDASSSSSSSSTSTSSTSTSSSTVVQAVGRDVFLGATAAADLVVLPERVQRLLIQVLRVLAERQGLTEQTALLSDRTFLVKASKIIKTHALLHGRSIATAADLAAITFMTTFRIPANVHSKLPGIISAVVDGVPDSGVKRSTSPSTSTSTSTSPRAPSIDSRKRGDTFGAEEAELIQASLARRASLRTLLAKEALDKAAVEARDPLGNTPLIAAAETGDLAKAAELLEALGANIEARGTTTGATALVTAASEHGNTDMVILLLENGANIEAGWGATHGTSLTRAARNNDVATVAALLAPRRRVHVEACDDREATALIHAATAGAVDALKLLLVGGPDPAGVPANIEATNELGATALLCAAEAGQAAAAKVLVENGADARTVDDGGCTPLIAAAMEGHASVVDVLLSHTHNSSRTSTSSRSSSSSSRGTRSKVDSVDGLEAACDHGRTALIWAADAGAADVVGLLARAGADVAASDVGGDTARDRALYRGHDGIAEALRRLEST